MGHTSHYSYTALTLATHWALPISLQVNPLYDKSVIYYIVFDANYHPMLILDIEDDSWVDEADLCFKADNHIRQGLKSMSASCPLPRLWGLSLLGTSLRA